MPGVLSPVAESVARAHFLRWRSGPGGPGLRFVVLVGAAASLEAGGEDVGAIGGVGGVGCGEERLERRSRNAEPLVVTDEEPAGVRCGLHVVRTGDVLLAPEGGA